jgi:hypothetical protein
MDSASTTSSFASDSELESIHDESSHQNTTVSAAATYEQQKQQT